MDKKILVSFPNTGENHVDSKIVKSWNPKDAHQIGETIFFTVGNLWVSMKVTDYKEIYGDKPHS